MIEGTNKQGGHDIIEVKKVSRPESKAGEKEEEQREITQVEGEKLRQMSQKEAIKSVEKQNTPTNNDKKELVKPPCETPHTNRKGSISFGADQMKPIIDTLQTEFTAKLNSLEKSYQQNLAE